MKVLLFFLVLSFSSNKIYDQDDNFEFQRNFIKIFKYPESLKSSCIATFTNIIIDVSVKGIIQNVTVSDSAPKAFQEEFNLIKDKLNTDLIETIVVNNKLRNCYIIIPTFYIYSSDYCVNSFESAGYIAENYINLKGKKIEKLTYNLKPIINTLYKPLH